MHKTLLNINSVLRDWCSLYRIIAFPVIIKDHRKFYSNLYGDQIMTTPIGDGAFGSVEFQQYDNYDIMSNMKP